MRLDKYLADMDFGSRKEVKQFIKKGLVSVNGTVVKSDKFQVNENEDNVVFDGEPVVYQKYFYYLLNKPAGVISATIDDYDETVMDLFDDEDYRDDLFPVGRLDKDTEGLLVITNDGALAHRLLSPKRHVEKEYYAQVAGMMTPADVVAFEKGLTIDGGEECLPAKLMIDTVNEVEETSEIRLILHEGKFHQVKRMVQAVGKEVTYLKRIRMGGLSLDETLDYGEHRGLTEAELVLLEQKS
ncbi:pseudouridine synthase [Enterococcus saccharolyticus]|uniref:Pseudouridine synthase n=1 Tax=Enterococcus saccharolyticus subsp. saccharolyticus ATCC 43076 TaxID=1139996 RepID=S0NFK6_9ENTE|nr:pseudouridine synthase [Enterococcus saccharolyticus]EOT30433.1 16S rRNA pseudouridylate synthase A [Enterococcus saccharolyticus subsp. saccharolyticus ATCC 43076]EOT79994.1 16S rRNA pseudouridylate synthase A [Enterococcus saccharolyticus subsp. saccharolyticus ATCC 43076]OJG89206.1 16S rRNA pseudouridylate synthase A [Enterococcus saccharolyticus]